MVYVIVIIGFVAALVALWRRGLAFAAIGLGAAPSIALLWASNLDRLAATPMLTAGLLVFLSLAVVAVTGAIFTIIGMASDFGR